jgi:hypothetical protein
MSSTRNPFTRDRFAHEQLASEIDFSPDDGPSVGHWRDFCEKVFGWDTFAQRHRDFWNWADQVEYGEPLRPFIGVWPRGGAKSSSVQAMIAYLGAKRAIRYVLYVSGTQDQADKHVQEVSSALSQDYLEENFPDLTQKAVDKYGKTVGWRRDRLATKSGLTIDALGLDTSARGIKFEQQRPDLIVFDDLDEEHDSTITTDNKETKLTRKVLGTGTSATKVVGVQNLIIPDGIFARIVSGDADYLVEAEISGPEPAVEDLEYEQVETEGGYRYKIIGGEPTWQGQDLSDCEQIINQQGPTTFKLECQHEVSANADGMFSHIKYRRCSQEDVPWGKLERIVIWMDPAVTSSDRADCQALQLSAFGDDFEDPATDVVYHLYSYEQQGSPHEIMQRAIMKAVEYGADKVGVETDQGGETWQDTFERAWETLVEDPEIEQIDEHTQKPAYDEDKASKGYGSKRSRGQQMLSAYERGDVVHVRGTHQTLESALNRFDPPDGTPFDLVDATFWSWNDLTDRPTFSFS